MMELILKEAVLKLENYIHILSDDDGYLSDEDLNKILESLDSIRAAIEYEQSCREEALSCAGERNIRTEI